MKRAHFLLLAGLILTASSSGQRSNLAAPANAPPSQQSPAVRLVDLKASDGVILKASYFAAGKSGPGMLLLHQANRTRSSWDDLALQLAAVGINTLTLDMRGFGESGGKRSERQTDVDDVDRAFQYLVSQPGVRRDMIGVIGAGALGVDQSVELARQHSSEVRSLALLSGETFQEDLQFLRQASKLPGLFVVSDDDEYPPTQEAMELLYITSSNPGKKLVHYSAAQDAPWVWYETRDASKVPASGGHGTDMFRVHPELPGIVVNWFLTTLIKTPGHAPADTLASAAIINRIRMPGGVAQVTQLLKETRRQDPEAQLFPEIAVSIIGQDHMRAGEPKLAVEVLKLVLLAYPESADAHETLAEAYLADGQKDLAQQHAEKALALLKLHTVPASSWTDTEQYRGEIRSGAQDVLKKLSLHPTTVPVSETAGRVPGTVFRDCPDCPEMVVIPAGSLMMGSSESEKSWASSRGATPDSVSDESPQHKVQLKSFALGRYDVTRGEYAAFVSETGYHVPDGCYESSMPGSNELADWQWLSPDLSKNERYPMTCVSWQDARAYVAWLNDKLHRSNLSSNGTAYRLPSESEWEYAARADTTTRFWWGDDDKVAADFAWFKDNSANQPHSVGLKPANPFGLYDIVGNVWQWTEDCYAESYVGVPTDGSANEVGKDCLRSDRGGSWLYAAWLLRAATRERNPANYRDVIMGFRLASTLP
jgi:formylglycine-generating enzyme required for sulfatase activity